MGTEPDLLLDRVERAMSQQSWREAWALIEQVNPDYRGDDRHLGARRQEFLLLAAHCLRHRGHLDQARQVYDLLLQELPLNDGRLAEALTGKAELLHAENNFGDAIQLLRAAQYVPNQRLSTQLRRATTNAHVFSHVNIKQGLQLFEAALQQWPEPEGTLGANLRFWHGDALLVAGDYQRSESELLVARELAAENGCAVTLADCMRRLPLLRALRGNSGKALSDLHDITQAQDLYHSAGDRGFAYLHTENGEVHRSLDRLREAESEFQRGLWASRDIGDLNREGHNQLGLFEVSRQSHRPRMELLDEAQRCYAKVRSDWGELHVLISRALVDDREREALIRQAQEHIKASRFSAFRRERGLLEWLRTAHAVDVEQELHLMNYP